MSRGRGWTMEPPAGRQEGRLTAGQASLGRRAWGAPCLWPSQRECSAVWSPALLQGHVEDRDPNTLAGPLSPFVFNLAKYA